MAKAVNDAHHVQKGVCQLDLALSLPGPSHLDSASTFFRETFRGVRSETMSSFAPASKRGRVDESTSYPPGAEFFPGTV